MVNNVTEWQKQQRWQPNEMRYVVMTDEQLETLRKQIAVYATICEQLVEMHKTISSHQDLAGFRLGNLYSDPLLGCGGPKLGSRQRWTPTSMQLQILERIFEQGTGTPSKDKIKEIASELSQHGQISETNVYNWFQNRRARSKRKHHSVAPCVNNGESEVETEVDSKDNKTKPDEFQTAHSLQFLNSDSTKQDSVFPSDNLPVFDDGLLSNSSSGYLTGKMEAPESYDLYEPAGNYNMSG